SRVLATRAARPPVIDGRDDDAVWREAPPIAGFQEWRPSEGGPPKLSTEAKIAYDAANLYVFVRAFDPHPDSIITVLARRDYFTPSDMIWLFLDSYHDRRTGYEFGVNPSGVKLDAQVYNDGNEDFAWDAVWDVATRVDSLGWTAEFRVTPNFTLDATVNPDFGQVEADPGVLNLSAFETFFREQRPFFVQGAGTFRFDLNCTAVNDCNTGEGLVYSRRIGRGPELAGTYSDTTSPAFTRILGAGKLTGRLPGGMTIGVLDAVTQHVTGVGGVTIEPTTNYGVVRLRQDVRGGETSVGGIVTAVNRDNDSFTSPYLRRRAYVGGADFRHRFPGGRFELWGSLDLSRV